MSLWTNAQLASLRAGPANRLFSFAAPTNLCKSVSFFLCVGTPASHHHPTHWDLRLRSCIEWRGGFDCGLATLSGLIAHIDKRWVRQFPFFENRYSISCKKSMRAMPFVVGIPPPPIAIKLPFSVRE